MDPQTEVQERNDIMQVPGLPPSNSELVLA
jgi:hypothetical protein